MFIDPHPIDIELAQLPETAPAEQRLAVIWRHYSAATGAVVSEPPTDDERRSVHEWLRNLHRGDEAPALMAKPRTLRLLASMSPKEKASTLAHLRCGACEVVEGPGGVAFGRQFPIEVDPWSAQVDSARNAKLKSAVTEMLRSHYRGTPVEGLPLCVSIVSLMPQSHRRKDADNLLTGLLDSLASVVYDNDAQIQCLTSRRVEYAGPSGLYLVSVRAVRPWAHDTVWDDPSPPKVIWGSPILGT